MLCKQVPHGLVLARNAPDFMRSPGLHMSDIYNSLYKDIDPKRYDKRDEDGNPEELNLAKLEAGMGFEMRLEPLLDGERPGEFFTQHAKDCSLHGRPVRDGALLCHCGAGVAYSPDWLFYEDTETVLGEFKFSWYSMRDFPDDPKFDKWVCQVKAYLYHLRLLKARVYPYWVNGSYPRSKDGFVPPSPSFEHYYEMTFGVQELYTNWVGLLRHAWKKGLIPA
jgi:hypothetical protein